MLNYINNRKTDYHNWYISGVALAFSIREFLLKDISLAINLMHLNTPAYFSPKEEKDFIHYLEKEREYYYVVESGNTIIGCGGINFADHPGLAKISWDIIHPDFQGKGIGSQLLQFRIEKIKSLNPSAQIMVRTSQHAYTFYQKNNFTLKEVIKDYWAKGYDLYTMQYQFQNT